MREDAVSLYCRSINIAARARTVICEGTTDAALFQFAARLERQESGVDLLNDELSFVAAGTGDNGGTSGVNRTLIALREMAKICLQPNGRPFYRFLGLYDNDQAGRAAIQGLRFLDRSILEYRDVFRLRPVMPVDGTLDPGGLERNFDLKNAAYRGLDWELEDLIPETLFREFRSEYASCAVKEKQIGGRVHRDYDAGCKAQFHRFVKANAIHRDMSEVIGVIRALRVYLGLRTL